jgi:hypothetical protein
MMSCAARGAPLPVALVGSHPLLTVPVSGQSCDATLLSHIVAACLHILQVMMMSLVHSSYGRLGNTRAYLGNMQA